MTKRASELGYQHHLVRKTNFLIAAAREHLISTIEIVSPADYGKRDYGIKLFKYRAAGVREYWIVNPAKEIVNVYNF